MRYDIRVMWVEDMEKWYEQAKEIFEMDIEDRNLSVDIKYINDGKELIDNLERAQTGFKLYDIFFIDYSLSNGIVGSNVIKDLRKINIDSDILFYSSDHETKIREQVVDDLNSFEGVYIANRNNFREKSLYLLKKNARRLLSISNIRGLLMDQTAENDYIIFSYLLKKYDTLSKEQKEEIKSMVLDYMLSKQQEYEKKSKKEIEKIEENGITNINKFLKLASYIVPLDLKYKIFEMILKFNGNENFDDYTIENYLNKIVKNRNNLAHKKLDICDTQEYILYYNNINQYLSSICPDDCDCQTNGKRISVEEWMGIRKQVIEYGKCFDIILEQIMGDIKKEVAAANEN